MVVVVPSTCVAYDTAFRGGVCGEKANTCEAADCDASLCKTCFAQHPLWVSETNDLQNGQVQRFCPSCFQARSTLSFERSFDSTASSSGTTFLFVHGASACREMFRPHATALHEQHGHGYILMDLPGHGTLTDDVKLTLESCVSTTKSVIESCGLPETEKLVYVGGSLGAYVGFYVLHELKDKFDGAVLLDCGQNVGPDRGMAAGVGLVFLKLLAEQSSNYSLMNMMASVSKKSPADYHLVDSVFGAGIWFDQGGAHVECLRAVNPVEYLPHLSFPILFMNGSEDHRDSENRWLEACPNKSSSSLKVYEGGDHFFTHDSRFVDDILDRMHAFQQNL